MEKNVEGVIGQMNRITDSFNSLKVITILSVISAMITALACVFLFTVKIGEYQNRVFVLDNGAAFSATAQESSVTRRDEVRHHVELFHNYLFNVAPSTEMIIRNVEKALEMADKSAYNYYNDLQETGFYKRMTSTQSYQQIVIEDIQIDMSSYPYQVLVKATQFINRESNVSKYSLITRCNVTNALRTSKNLNGLMIERFEVIENNLIETRKK